MTGGFSKTIFAKRNLVIADQFVFSGGSFLLTILLARILGPLNFGVYSAFLLLIYLLVSMLNAIVNQPFQVLQAKYSSHSYVSFNFWIQFLLILISLLSIKCMLYFDIKAFEALKKIGYPGMMMMIGFSFHDYFRKTLLALDKVKQALTIDCLLAFIQTSLLFFELFQSYAELNVTLYLLSIAYLPGMFVALYFIKPKFDGLSNWGIFLKDQLKQGKWLFITAITQWWAGNFYIVSAGILLGAEAVGAFRLVQSLFGIFNVLLQTLENHSLPEASRLFEKSREEAKNYLKKTTTSNGLIFAAILSVLYFFPDYFLDLAGGKKYINYAFLVKGMSILYLFVFLSYPVRLSVRMLLLAKNFFYGYLISLLTSLVLADYLLSHYALMGAVIGLIVSQIILLAYYQWILFKSNFILWK